MYNLVLIPFWIEWSVAYEMMFALSRMSLHVVGDAGSLKMEVVMLGSVCSMVLCAWIVVAIVVTC